MWGILHTAAFGFERGLFEPSDRDDTAHRPGHIDARAIGTRARGALFYETIQTYHMYTIVDNTQ